VKGREEVKKDKEKGSERRGGSKKKEK